VKLITKEIAKRTPALYSTERAKNPVVQAKFFCPWNQWTWYMTEYQPTDGIAFGYVVGHDSELGYFSIPELESIRGIERDIYFKPTSLSEIREKG
jgi:hypothetical protein